MESKEYGGEREDEPWISESRHEVCLDTKGSGDDVVSEGSEKRGVGMDQSGVCLIRHTMTFDLRASMTA
jgi:hypothetical protein